MAEVATHPTGEELAAFAAGRLPELRRQELERHIEQCGECCRRLEALPEDTLVERLRSSVDESPTPSMPEPPTRRIAALDESIPSELVDHPRYRIVRSIGGGGMGQVFLAEHRIMERPVVLKIVRRELLADPFAVRRFRVEVKAAAQLSHANIVHAHDADQAGDLHFFVMEFVEGVSLSKAVSRHGALPLLNACYYVRQAALGLQHAHEKGMVHRDIKPQNLMLTPGGQIKILDFGLAQFAREAALHEPQLAPPATGEHSGTIVTEAGTVFGTPDYMAPEQAVSARDVDIRADIYSLGCTLHFLLTGKPPFPAGTSHEKIAAHRSRPLPEPKGTREPLPAELAAVLTKMTAKSPDDRYATPHEVAQALAPFARSSKSKSAATTPTDTAAGPSAATDAPSAAASPNVNIAPSTALIVAVDTARSIRRTPPAKRSRAWFVAAAVVGVAVVGVAVVGFAGRRWSGSGAGEPKEPATPPVAAAPAAPARRPTVLIFLPQMFASADFYNVRNILLADGTVDVKIAGCGVCTPYDANYVGKVTPDFRLPMDVPRVADFDALYFPGGNVQAYKQPGPVRDEIGRLIDEFAKAQKPVAALAQGQGMFAIHGTLQGRSGTPHYKIAEMFPGYIKKPQRTPVTVDGPFITAADENAAKELAATLLSEIRRRRPAPPASP